MSIFDSYMGLALEEAISGVENGEIPVGAVVVNNDTREVISKAHNMTKRNMNPTAHAEMLAIDIALQHYGPYLDNCSIYTTLEPCPMCAFTIALVHMKRLYIGALDPKYGAVIHGPKLYINRYTNHIPECYTEIMEDECSSVLSSFFKNLRSCN